MKQFFLGILLTIVASVSAQTVENVKGNVLPHDSAIMRRDTLFNDSLLSGLHPVVSRPMMIEGAATQLSVDPNLYDIRRGSWEVHTMHGGVSFNPWQNAFVMASGGADSMPGLLDRESGALTLYQMSGRWTFSASALADKYRLVGMGFLQTRYGVGGSIDYRLSNAVSLHAFGYYYGNSTMISPMVNPFLATTNYGGYADFRISKNFGVDAGVRRYLNPMTGQWQTEPIVSPYLRFNNGQKIGFDIGPILREVIWGHHDHQLPHGPVRMAPPPQKRR